MIRKQLTGFGFGIGLALAAPAWSADTPADHGWFLEASALEARSSGGEGPLTFDDDDFGIAVGGGYQFTKHLALEAKYYESGEHVATDCPAPLCTTVPHEYPSDLNALSFAAIGTWQVAPLVEVFGKLGVLGSRARFDGALDDDTDRAALLGAGVGIRITPQWRLNVQFERAANELELESAGIGATFRF